MSKGFSKIYKAQLTPKGVFKFPKLNTPDSYNNDLKYKATLLVEPDAAEVPEFIAKLERIRDEEIERIKRELTDAGKAGLAKKVGPRDVYKLDLDKSGEETGLLAFDVSMKAEVKRKSDDKIIKLRPKFFDAKGRDISNPPEIWGGTVGRFGVDIFGSKRPADGAIGTTLRLDAVFLIDLKSGGGRDASAYGFQGDEGGYEYDGDGASSAGYDGGTDDDVDNDDF